MPQRALNDGDPWWRRSSSIPGSRGGSSSLDVASTHGAAAAGGGSRDLYIPASERNRRRGSGSITPPPALLMSIGTDLEGLSGMGEHSFVGEDAFKDGGGTPMSMSSSKGPYDFHADSAPPRPPSRSGLMRPLSMDPLPEEPGSGGARPGNPVAVMPVAAGGPSILHGRSSSLSHLDTEGHSQGSLGHSRSSPHMASNPPLSYLRTGARSERGAVLFSPLPRTSCARCVFRCFLSNLSDCTVENS